MPDIVLLTCHGKAAAIAPPLATVGGQLRSETSYDTDQLGTFSGEIARSGSQRDAARQKASPARPALPKICSAP